MRRRCYYAHFMGTYDTQQEKIDIEFLESLGFKVVNPNTAECDAAYRIVDKQFAFFMGVIHTCHVVAFRCLDDGAISAGVGKEVLFAVQNNLRVIELGATSIEDRIISKEDTLALMRDLFPE
jgi:hypothetical protein